MADTACDFCEGNGMVVWPTSSRIVATEVECPECSGTGVIYDPIEAIDGDDDFYLV